MQEQIEPMVRFLNKRGSRSDVGIDNEPRTGKQAIEQYRQQNVHGRMLYEDHAGVRSKEEKYGLNEKEREQKQPFPLAQRKVVVGNIKQRSNVLAPP